MAVNPMEEVAKRMQGLKDARGPEGILSRGNTVYNGTSNAAQSGPGGADMGRPPANQIQMAQTAMQNQQAQPVQQSPTAVPQAALQAVLQKTGMQQAQASQTPQTRPGMPGSVVASPGSVMAGNPMAEKAAAQSNRKVGLLARSAMQAAAQRKISRGM